MKEFQFDWPERDFHYIVLADNVDRALELMRNRLAYTNGVLWDQSRNKMFQLKVEDAQVWERKHEVTNGDD